MVRRTRRRRWWGDWHWRRLSGTYDLTGINLPRVMLGAEGDHGEEFETRYVAVHWGNGNSDPVWSVNLDLDRTRAGWLLAEIVWCFRALRHRWTGEW